MKNVGNKMLMQRFLKKIVDATTVMAKLYETEYEYGHMIVVKKNGHMIRVDA